MGKLADVVFFDEPGTQGGFLIDFQVDELFVEQSAHLLFGKNGTFVKTSPGIPFFVEEYEDFFLFFFGLCLSIRQRGVQKRDFLSTPLRYGKEKEGKKKNG